MVATTKRQTPAPATGQAAESARLSGAHILCESLLQEKVDVLFGYPGGVVIPWYDILPRYPLRHILVRHEQAAAHAADGYARASGRVGVCVATSGPGATNLVTGIANAYMDSVPMVAITGQVATNFVGKDAFQETDIQGITLPITKHNYLLERTDQLAPTIKEAFHLASTGRPGPVLVDIPKDVFTNEAAFAYPTSVKLRGYQPTLHGNVRQIRQAARLIAGAERPLILAGHGVLISQAFAELRELAEKNDIPVATTLLGISGFPEHHPLFAGLIGMHGLAHTNLAINQADVLIAIGMRFDDRVTGKLAMFAPHARIVHIDIDPAEIGKNVKVEVPIVGDVKNVLQVLNQEIERGDRSAWLAHLRQLEQEHPSVFIRESEELLGQYVIQQLSETTGGDAYVVADVGQHQMWAAQYYTFHKPHSFITSGGLGTMGFALPASMGVKLARPDDHVWVVCGDGGFQMTMQELGTIVQERINVKIAILNNGYLGMVRQWQDLFYARNYSATPIFNPDYVKLAEAYGIPGYLVKRREDVAPAMRRAMEVDSPVIIDFQIEPEENVFPMVPPGGANVNLIEDPRR